MNLGSEFCFICFFTFFVIFLQYSRWSVWNVLSNVDSMPFLKSWHRNFVFPVNDIHCGQDICFHNFRWRPHRTKDGWTTMVAAAGTTQHIRRVLYFFLSSFFFVCVIIAYRIFDLPLISYQLKKKIDDLYPNELEKYIVFGIWKKPKVKNGVRSCVCVCI